MVSLYWNIGRIITQDIQQNEKRAEYGTTLLKELAGILTQEYGAWLFAGKFAGYAPVL